MTVRLADDQKQKAVAQHSRQAGQFAERYERLEREVYRSCFAYSRHRLNAWLDRILPQSGTGLRLLDVGCGTGHHLRDLRQRGFQVAGVDGSAEMLEHARRLNPDCVIEQSDVDRLPFADRSFDYVVCIEVLRYLPDPRQALGEMARVLRPGGICLTTAAPLLNANGYWLVNRAANLLPVRRLVRLKQFFTTSWRIRQQCRAAGFDAVEVHGVYTGPINWIERAAPWALSPLLRAWEPIDRRVANAPVCREFSNMFLIRAVRGE